MNMLLLEQVMRRVVREELAKIVVGSAEGFVPPVVTDNERAKREALLCLEKSRERRARRVAAKDGSRGVGA